MLALKTGAEVVHRRGFPRFLEVAARITPAIDDLPQSLRLRPCRATRPIWKPADRDPALLPGASDPIIEDERSGAGRSDAHAKAGDFVIEGDPVAAGRGVQPPDDRGVKMCALACRRLRGRPQAHQGGFSCPLLAWRSGPLGQGRNLVHPGPGLRPGVRSFPLHWISCVSTVSTPFTAEPVQ